MEVKEAMKRLSALAACSVFLACVSAATAGLVTVRFDPPDQTVNLGDPFSVSLVADISDPVLGWGLDFTIANPSVAALSGPPVIGPQWFPFSTPDGDGLGGIAFPNSISGNNVLLATLNFTADSLGDTNLLLSVTPGDLTEGFPLDPTGFATLSFEPGHVTVIPEPASVAILAFAGLGAIRPVRRRFR